MKISYRCTKNTQGIIQNYNKKNTNNSRTKKTNKCNGQDKSKCPTPGEFCTKALIYEATTTSRGKTAEYIGSTATDFKIRFNNHKKASTTKNTKAKQHCLAMCGKIE